MLCGIVVKNAIALIEQIDIQREQGKPLIDSVITVSRLRLRPILITVLTTVEGMNAATHQRNRPIDHDRQDFRFYYRFIVSVPGF